MYVTTWPISKRGNKWEMLSYEMWTDGRTMVCHIKPVFWRAYKSEWPISWNYEYIIFGQIIFSKLSSVWLRRGCLFAWRTDGHNSGVFRRWMEICEWKHEYKVHRLHATWVKPEVVATKKYTGYLHYRFITTGTRFLWSPCCSYMCFFEFLCSPANCLSVYDIVFPMFWTFLWWVNGSVSDPILHML